MIRYLCFQYIMWGLYSISYGLPDLMHSLSASIRSSSEPPTSKTGKQSPNFCRYSSSKESNMSFNSLHLVYHFNIHVIDFGQI